MHALAVSVSFQGLQWVAAEERQLFHSVLASQEHPSAHPALLALRSAQHDPLWEAGGLLPGAGM